MISLSREISASDYPYWTVTAFRLWIGVGIISTFLLVITLKRLISSVTRKEIVEILPSETPYDIRHAAKNNYCLFIAVFLLLTTLQEPLFYLSKILFIVNFGLLCTLLYTGFRRYHTLIARFLPVFLFYLSCVRGFGNLTLGLNISIFPIFIVEFLIFSICLGNAVYSAYSIGKKTSPIISTFLWIAILITAYHASYVFWTFLMIDIPWNSVNKILTFESTANIYYTAIVIISGIFIYYTVTHRRENTSIWKFTCYILLILLCSLWLFSIVPAYQGVVQAKVYQQPSLSLTYWIVSLLGCTSLILLTGNKHIFTINQESAGWISIYIVSLLLSITALQIIVS